MSGLKASQIVEKLAFIHKQAYIECDFGGVDLPPHEFLIRDSSSQSTGEKRAKSLLHRVTSPFSMAAGSLMMATTMLASPMTATAQQAPTVSTVSVDEIRVPTRDVRGIDLYSIQGSAGVASVGHIVIIYGSSDPRGLEIVKDSARDAIRNGLPVRGILVSDAYEGEIIEIWAGSDRFAAEVPPFDNLKNKMDNTLEDAAVYAAEDLEIRQREQVAQASSPATGLR